MPDFSTTTSNDKVVASITMMATLQAYFTYGCVSLCGIPRVTLLGTRDDWVQLRTRVDKLPSFGEQPTQWHKLLAPILSRFVKSFDSPNSQANVDFWQTACSHHADMSWQSYLTGWITGLCFWDKNGRRLDKKGCHKDQLKLDGVGYHLVDDSDRSAGWVGVPVHVNDNGLRYEGRLVAGHVGTGCREGYDKSVRPVSGWWMCKLIEEQSM